MTLAIQGGAGEERSPPEEDIMEWKQIAPWNWFKEEEPSPTAARTPARLEPSTDPFAALRSEMDRWFDEAFRRFPQAEPFMPALTGRLPSPLRPSVDISEGKITRVTTYYSLSGWTAQVS